MQEITVTDNGIGSSPENLNQIWERFYRVSNVRNDEFGSCGLGLAMVNRMVKLHGGTTSAKSELGKGSQFKIILKV